MKETSVTDVLADLEAGVFMQKVARALSDVALGAVTTGKKGKVTIDLDIKQIASSSQVEITHKVKFVRPTPKGRITEENASSTPMHVGTGGVLSLFPEQQTDLFKKRDAGQSAPAADG